MISKKVKCIFNMKTDEKTIWRARAMCCGLGTLVLLPLAAHAWQGGSPVKLHLKFKQGEKTKYQTTMQMNIAIPLPNQPQPMKQTVNVSMIQEHEVTKVLPNGGAVVTVTTTNQQTTANGQTQPGAAVPPLTMTYDAQGRVSSMKGLPTSNPATGPLNSMFNSGGMANMGFLLPNRAVKPGDTWTQAVNLPGFVKGGTAKCTYLKNESVGTFKTARIRTLVTMPLNMKMNQRGQPTTNAAEVFIVATGSGKVTADTNVAIAEGKIIRTSGSGNIAMLMKPKQAPAAPAGSKAPQALKMNMKMEMGMKLIP